MPEGCNPEFYKNRMQAYNNILGNPPQHDNQLKRYTLSSGINGLAKDCLGPQKTPKHKMCYFFTDALERLRWKELLEEDTKTQESKKSDGD